MNYSKIKYFDIANGPGIRTSLFVSGCPIHCQGCFNQETWDFTGGSIFSLDVALSIFKSMNEHIAGLSILGGEPLAVQNYPVVQPLASDFKRNFPDKTIWLWTGYEWDQVKNYTIMDYIDVCVAGPFDVTKRDLSLKWCGSSNQQVIDVKKTKTAGKVVLYEENHY